MSSPPRQSRYSNGSLLRSSTTGGAIRRGEIKISDPIPHDQDQSTTTYRPNSEWPIKTATADNQRGRHYSTGYLGPGDPTRASMGPSLVPSSMSSAPSKESISRQKPTGFRATLRRMFGSKRGRPSIAEDGGPYHRSDPGNLTSIAEGTGTPGVARIPSQPSGSVTRESALGSHGPNQNYYPAWDAEQFTPSPLHQHRRRNTLPSLVITDEMAQTLAEPNNKEMIARSLRRTEEEQRRYNRRSRSADALNKMISEISIRNAGIRDRESDIAYWRKSIVDNPLPANPSWQDQRDDVTQSTMSETEPSTKLTTIQTFDFGLDEREGKDVTLDDRVNTLEVKLIDFEYAIAKLQGQDIRTAPHPKVPKRRSIHDLFPETDSGMSNSSREPTSFLSSPDNSPLPQEEGEQSFAPDRTSKATTIRPLTAHRRSEAAPESPVRFTVDHSDKLMDMLHRETAARRQLEAQVNEMQKELEALRTPVYAEIREIEKPSTPNRPGVTHETPSTNRTLRRSPPFAQKESKQAEQSRFSMSDVESDYYDEVYETPQDTKFTFEQSHHRGSPLIGVN